MQINLAATFVIGISVYLEVFARVYIKRKLFPVDAKKNFNN